MTTTTRVALGQRIRQLRKAEGLSQEKLALMVNVERSYLAKLETGKRNPSIDVIEKIACGLGVSLSELFEGIDIVSPKVPGKGATGKPARTPRQVHYRFIELPD